MIDLQISQIVEAVSGEIINLNDNSFLQKKINGIEIDSRKELSGKLFIAISGDKFDGHDYIIDVYKKSAVCCISEKNMDIEFPYIKVESTKKALQDLARYYRNLFDVKIVAVTGSSGKTTSKDMIASVLSQKYNVLKTMGNFNNEIGLPLTIFNMDENTEVCVLEMGMNHFGEIHNLSKIATPDICVITNIGVSHIENLGSREGILKAKSEIFDFMKTDGKKILYGDDDLLSKIQGSNIIFYGTNSDNNFYADNIIYNGLNGTDFDIKFGTDEISVGLKKPGKHMVLNSLAAAAVGTVLGVEKDLIKRGIENFESTYMRMEILKTDKYTILNDVYNANPDSMKAALDVLAKAEGRRVCILGDMLELGEYSPKMHYEIGEYAANLGIELVISMGKLAENIYKGAEDKNENNYYFENIDALNIAFDKLLEDKDTILIKASRGMHFENIVERILSR